MQFSMCSKQLYAPKNKKKNASTQLSSDLAISPHFMCLCILSIGENFVTKDRKVGPQLKNWEKKDLVELPSIIPARLSLGSFGVELSLFHVFSQQVLYALLSEQHCALLHFSNSILNY